MVSSFVFAIVSFLLHVLTLKLAAGTMGVPRAHNRYSRALAVVLGLSVLGFVLGLIPVLGWLLYPLVWVVVVKSAYDLSVLKSVGVALVQVALKIGLWLVFKLFGIHMLLGDALTFGL